MQLLDELRDLLARQQTQLKQLEGAVRQLEQADFQRENHRLLQETQRYREEFARLRVGLDKLKRENTSLRDQLAGQMYSQRESILNSAKKQTDILFKQEEDQAVNALAQTNAQLRQRLSALRGQLEGQGAEAAPLLGEVARLEEATRQFMRRASGQLQQGFAQERQQAERDYDYLAKQPLTQGQIGEKMRQNSVELRIGSKITVIVGVFFILLAVVFGLRYTFEVIRSNVVKGALAYGVGLILLGAGEWMARRQKTAFTTGLQAGGIAVLFASTAVSYFNLEILSMGPAVGICVGVAALALIQSMRHDAQVIAVFALIGGYLPMTAVNGTPVMIISATVYFLVLNLFVLLVALRKRWQALKFFSLSLNMIGAAVLLFFPGLAAAGGGMFYLAANFLLYLAVVLVYPLWRQTDLRTSDTVLLALNTLAGAGGVFALMAHHGHQSLYGAAAVACSLLFFGLGTWLHRVLQKAPGPQGLFFATCFAFWVLAVPLQFDTSLLSLGWLIEGAALWVFGVLVRRKWYRWAGGALFALCLATFLVVDVPFGRFSSLFPWRYGAVTAGLVVMAGVALYQYAGESAYWQSAEGKAVLACKWLGMANLWLFGGYMIGSNSYLETLSLNWESFWQAALLTVLSLGLAVIYRAVKPLWDKGVRGIVFVLYILGFGFSLAFGQQAIPGHEAALWGAGLAALIVIQLGAVAALYEWLRTFARIGSITSEWPGLGASILALVLVVQVLMVQGGMPLRSMILSFVFIVWAFALIVFGFVNRYAVMRRVGLALSLVSISKLFLVDLSFLKSGQRVLSYFVFGLVFIAIGYVYQLFARKLLPDTASLPKRPPSEDGGQDLGAPPQTPPKG